MTRKDKTVQIEVSKVGIETYVLQEFLKVMRILGVDGIEISKILGDTADDPFLIFHARFIGFEEMFKSLAKLIGIESRIIEGQTS